MHLYKIYRKHPVTLDMMSWFIGSQALQAKIGVTSGQGLQ